MKRKDYEQVQQIFLSAIELSPEKRKAFLDEKCGGNDILRNEVESLLEIEDSQFMESPALAQVADIIVEEEAEIDETKILPDSRINYQFGNYKIISRIGKGGMGEVYLANDVNLDRRVAVKLLPPELINQREYLQRFKQEALAASALNHPYILTIFEFGKSNEDVHYIVSEFVEGQTLDKFCDTETLSLSKKLDILIKIAQALLAAHEASIIHRDLKPENVIVRKDGLIKVLDFGLAKFIRRPENNLKDSRAATRPLVETMSGMIMGTASYMSPEQAKGEDIDARTDIFSFGIVLYEMLVGYLPFEGNSAIDMIASILHKDPLPLNDAEIPDDVKKIIEKTLKKDRNERYLTMKDLIFDLKEVKRELEFQNKLEHNKRVQPDNKKSKTQTYKTRTTAEKIDGSTAQHIVETPSEKNRLSGFQIAFVIAFISIVSSSIWWFASGRAELATANNTALLPGSLKTSEITNWANAAGELSSTASFSPDGRFVAFGSTKSGATGIWVKQVASGDAIDVTKDEYYNRYPIWSPNGDEVIYYSKRGDTRGLWRVSSMGGQKRLITEKIDVESKPRLWSKSGKIYFQGSRDLFTADDNTGEVIQLTDFREKEMPVRIIKVSPDETRIAYLIVEKGSWKVYIRTLGQDNATQIIDSKTLIANLVWHRDGKGILYTQKTEGFYQIFTTQLDGTSPIQLTTTNTDSFVQDISSDGVQILFNSVTETSDLWQVNTETKQESLKASQIDAELWADVSPDGSNVVYQSIKNLRQGSNLLSGSIMLQQTSDRSGRTVRLAENGFLPQWSSDGETVAYLRLIGQDLEIWRVARTGDSLKQIFKDRVQSVAYSLSPYLRKQVKHLSWSPQGADLAFPATSEKLSNIWAVSADGTNERQITDNIDSNQLLYCPIWKSDASKIVFSSRMRKADSDGNKRHSIWSSDIEEKNQQKVLESTDSIRLLGWSGDEREIVFAVKKATKKFTQTPSEIPVRAVSVETGKVRNLLVLKDAYFDNIHLSSNRSLIGFTSRANGNDDVWVSQIEKSMPQQITQNNDSRLYYSSLVWSTDNKTILFGKQSRFTMLSILFNPRIMEEQK